MMATLTQTLADLYEVDETAWLDAMMGLVRDGRTNQLDYDHLAEHLEVMAKRDRRGIRNRLRILLGHLLKWTYQPEMHTNRWRTTINVQRLDLEKNSAKQRNAAKPRRSRFAGNLREGHRFGIGRDEFAR